MNLSQFEEAVWHGRGSYGDVAEPRHQGGEIVSPVEAVLEFREVSRHMLVTDSAVSAGNGALDVPEGGIDPLERGVQNGLAAGSGDNRLMDATSVADTGEAAQSVTDNGAGGIVITLRQRPDFATTEPLDPAQLQADRLTVFGGFDRPRERRFSTRTTAPHATAHPPPRHAVADL